MTDAALLAGARALVRRWRPGVTYGIARAASGGSTAVFQLTDQSGAAVGYLRLAEAPGEVRAAEVAVHRGLAAAGVTVPTIVAWEPAPPELDRSAAWTSVMPGVALAAIASGDVQAWSRTVREAGQELARINQVVVRGFGWVDRVGPHGDLIAAHERRSEWTTEYAAALTTVVSQRLLPKSTLAALQIAVTR